MASIFTKDTSRTRPPTNLEKIEKEISHLQGGSVRKKPGETSKRFATWVFVSVVGALLGLYFMDPFVYAMRKSNAISIYLYLNNHEAGDATKALIATHIFNKDEIAALNRRQGSYQAYFASPSDAKAAEAAVIAYMKGVNDLHGDHYDALDDLNKVRYRLFIETGLNPPKTWSMLNPSVE